MIKRKYYGLASGHIVSAKELARMNAAMDASLKKIEKNVMRPNKKRKITVLVHEL